MKNLLCQGEIYVVCTVEINNHLMIQKTCSQLKNDYPITPDMRVEELSSKIARDLSTSLINFILKNWRYDPSIMDQFRDQIKANCIKFSLKLLGSSNKHLTLKEAGFEAKQLFKSKIDLYQLTKELINLIELEQTEPIKKDAMLSSA